MHPRVVLQKLAFFCLPIFVGMVGCGETDDAVEAPTAETSAVGSKVPTTAPPLEPAAREASLDSPSDDDVTELQPEDEDSVAEFTPPYADRIDLFMAPQRNESKNRGISGSREEHVELLGFVNVDQLCAVLSVDGLVAPIGVGGTQHGIEVISIQPPSVVLQRGNHRWQAMLQN